MLVRILFLLSLFISINAYSGAAEKWEYEPVMKDMNIHVKAHKVDQYGTAVNDYEYNTKIDPKTDANRTKMGKVGFGRLLKSAGWGLLGSAALQALLEAVDWVIDPETQSIWRNKPNYSGGFACKNFGYKWKVSSGSYTCPVEAFADHNICKTNGTAKDCKIKELWADQWHTTKVSDLADSSIPERIDIEVSFDYNGTKDSNYITLYKADKIDAVQLKETLTPEELADYANHTHPDYSNPELAPKIEPKYSPEIASDLWKPSNTWEEANSPTVQEVNRQLDQAQPEPKEDPEITPNPDTGGMTLPSFCSWASPVCEFIKWFKDDSEKLEDDEIDIEIPEEQELDDSIFSTNEQCPPDLVITYTLLQTHQITYSYQNMCNAFTVARPVVIFIGGLIALFILGGYRSSE